MSDSPLSRLGHRYEVDREIGRGGMAAVYLAVDLKHDRPVALKVLHPELAAGITAARFLREIRISANLQHPHIVPLYDSGEVDGVLYYVMPLVEGESLRERLSRDGALALDAACEIAGEVADALGYAHESGVVHRDIKPENILLSRGHALVTDFGIATAIGAAADENLTQAGSLIGTPAYMSPEQVDGESDVDGRSDLYSLGCVLYEMLAGRPPFRGPLMAVLAQQALEKVTPLTELRPGLPRGVERVVARAMAGEPAERFQDGARFVEALEAAPMTRVGPPREPAGLSIAVLPFTNMSADPENQYFCDGMAEEIINALARLPTLDVAARTSSFAFRDRDLDLAEIGHRLHVSVVLEGSVRKAADDLRITAQLTTVADGYNLWSERFDRKLRDVFAIQDEIAAAIVDRLRPELKGDTPALEIRRGTDSPVAYDLYLQGRHLWQLRNITQAIEMFQQAIAEDPSFALPYCGIADALSTLGQLGFMPTTQARARAEEAVERALAIDSGMPEALSALGMIDFYLGWDPDGAEGNFRRALAAMPRLGDARAGLVMVLGLLGDSQALETEIQEGYRMEPLSAYFGRAVGTAHFFCQEPGPAIEALERVVAMEPYAGHALGILGWAYQQDGRLDRAIETLERAVELSRKAPIGVSTLGIAYAQAGRVAEAEAVARQLIEHESQSYVPPAAIAGVLAALDRMDEAGPWVEGAFRDRNPHIVLLGLWPGLRPLRADPGYVRRLEDAGFGYLLDRMDVDQP